MIMMGRSSIRQPATAQCHAGPLASWQIGPKAAGVTPCRYSIRVATRWIVEWTFQMIANQRPEDMSVCGVRDFEAF